MNSYTNFANAHLLVFKFSINVKNKWIFIWLIVILIGKTYCFKKQSFAKKQGVIQANSDKNKKQLESWLTLASVSKLDLTLKILNSFNFIIIIIIIYCTCIAIKAFGRN